MSLWRRVSGALKDKRSICVAIVGRRTGYPYTDLEKAIIRATSHDESSVDYKNTQRVFAWIRTSPTFLKPFLWVLSRRMERTRNWVVAVKGLMLVHGIFCSRTDHLEKIGRLPFDLSNFQDHFSMKACSSGFSYFVRAYFAFLDERSIFFIKDLEETDLEEKPMEKILIRLQKFQVLLDLLLQIKPYADGMNVKLVLEAMDCVVVEIFEIYSSICNGIAGVLMGLFNASQGEAAIALQVLRKSSDQSSRLSSYFEVCRDLGVLNATEFPEVQQIPDDDIQDLERIIYGISDGRNLVLVEDSNDKKIEEVEEEEEWNVICGSNLRGSGTIVTENWVVFNDEFEIIEIEDRYRVDHCQSDPFAASLSVPPIYVQSYENQEYGSIQLQHQQNSSFFAA